GMHYYSVFKDRRPQGQTETISLVPSAVNLFSYFLLISYQQRKFTRTKIHGQRQITEAEVPQPQRTEPSRGRASSKLHLSPLGRAKVHGRADRYQTRDKKHPGVAPQRRDDPEQIWRHHRGAIEQRGVHDRAAPERIRGSVRDDHRAQRR